MKTMTFALFLFVGIFSHAINAADPEPAEMKMIAGILKDPASVKFFATAASNDPNVMLNFAKMAKGDGSGGKPDPALMKQYMMSVIKMSMNPDVIKGVSKGVADAAVDKMKGMGAEVGEKMKGMFGR